MRTSPSAVHPNLYFCWNASSVPRDETDSFNGGRAGGMYIIGGQGKIEINNTFEERLRICETDALPSVRVTLFGQNENRKFND